MIGYLYKMAAVRFFVNDMRISTAVPLNDGTVLQVFPIKKKFVNQSAWEKYWDNSSFAKPKIRVEQEDNSIRNVKKDWICPSCNKGPGNDHRMCICNDFNYSVERWEIACGIRKSSSSLASSPAPAPAPPPSPAPTPSTSPENTLISITNVKREDWEHSNVKKYICPAGKYYIGDLCYVLGDSIYDTIFGGFGYESGLYKKKNTSEFFFVSGTAYGDGCYVGSDSKEFCVDAGIIGICPITCMSKDDGGGHIYTFTDPVECIFKNGIFKFISKQQILTINTYGEDNDEDY